jgi:peptide/nickel transport system substrate-binding protein
MSKRLVALFGAGVIVLAACGAQTSPSASQPAASTTPGGTTAASASPTEQPLPDLTASQYKPEPVGATGTKPLIYAEWQDIDTLNYYYAQAETDIEAQMPALLGMVNASYDNKYLAFPNLALVDSVPLTSNGGVVVNGTKMDVTYKLHQPFNWSDGQPITCDDMTATWKWNMDPDNTGLAGGTTGWEDIESISGTGGDCVVHFKNIFEGYLGLFSPLFPKHYLDKIPVKDAATKLYPLTDVGSGVYSGPYIPTKYTTGAQLEYKSNPEYWKATGKKAPFPGMIYKYYGDADAEKAGFDQGEYDVATNLNHSDLPTLQGKEKLLQQNSTTFEAYNINNRSLEKKFGKDQLDTIKQALNLAVDRKEIATRALGGTVDPILSQNVYSPLYWWYKEEPAVTYDPDKAKQTLDAAGWAVGSDGFRAKNGVTLALDFCTTQRPYRVDALGLVAAQLAKIGIKVNVHPVPANPDFFGGWNAVAADTPCNLQHGNFDVGQYASVSPLDPLSGYYTYVCKLIPEDDPSHAGQNVTRTCDPKFDDLWNTVKSNLDLAKAREAMWGVQDYLNAHIAQIPLFFWKDVNLVNPKLHNMFQNSTTEQILWNIDDQWADQ